MCSRCHRLVAPTGCPLWSVQVGLGYSLAISPTAQYAHTLMVPSAARKLGLTGLAASPRFVVISVGLFSISLPFLRVTSPTPASPRQAYDLAWRAPAISQPKDEMCRWDNSSRKALICIRWARGARRNRCEVEFPGERGAQCNCEVGFHPETMLSISPIQLRILGHH